jgi:outer membrane protein assembly factor BamB/predicted Ser/Thr protein kinase
LCPRCLGALNLTADTALTHPTDERPAPPTPEELAPYFPQLEILESLGRGGMGVVYKARQKSLGRLVALKLLAPEREKDAEFAERFSREAKALAAMNHPHIVTIHDFGQSNGYFFLLMEFVDGVNLRQLLATRKLTPEEALVIVPPLCEALQYAHERGIVHRDIKPENLLLARDGRIKVVDFGIAKMLGAEAQVAEEKAAGTPGYMAPEQRDTPERVDSRADIYSLGVVFYEMLTGELPAKNLEPPSRKVAVDVRIDEVVLRALEKSPDLRWQTAAEMATNVEQVSASPRPAVLETPPGWSLVPVTSVVIAIACGFLVSWVLSEKGITSARWIGGAVAFVVPLIVHRAAVHLLLEKRQRARARGWAGAAAWLLVFGGLAAVPVGMFADFSGPRAAPLTMVTVAPRPGPPEVRVQAELDRLKRELADLKGSRSRAQKQQLEEAQLRCAVAEKTMQRQTELRKQLQISEAEYEKAALELELARAALRAAEAEAPAPPAAAAPTGTAGVGIVLKEQEGRFFIDRILPGSPAAAEGTLQPGHEIRSIGDSGDQLVSVEGWKLEDLVARLRGKEGTQVALFVVRSGVGTIVPLVRRKLPELELGREHPKATLQPGSPHPPAPEGALWTAERRVVIPPAMHVTVVATERVNDGEEIAFSQLDFKTAADSRLGIVVRWRPYGPDHPTQSDSWLLDLVDPQNGVIFHRITGKLPKSAIVSSPDVLPLPGGTPEAQLATPDSVTSFRFLRAEVSDGPGEPLRKWHDFKLYVSTAGPRDANHPPSFQLPSAGVAPGGGANSSSSAKWELRRFVETGASAADELARFPLLWAPSEPPVIIASRGPKLTAFWTDGGKIVWESNFDAAVCSAPVRGEKISRIYVGTSDQQFHALDAHGRRRWSFATAGPVSTPPAVADDVVTVGCSEGQVYGANAETGAILWTFGATATAVSVPGAAPALIVIGSSAGSAYALDPHTGKKQWSYQGTGAIYAPILAADELVYLATSGGEVVAVDAKTGDTRWTAKFGALADKAMAVGKEQLLVAESGRITALALPSGKQVWQTPAEDYFGPPVLAGESIIVARRNGTVRRLDFTGAMREEWNSGEAPVRFSSGPVAGGGAIWLTDDQGAIWRLGPNENP